MTGTLTRFAALSTLSRIAGEGPIGTNLPLKPLARNAGEGEPSPQGLVGEGFCGAKRRVPPSIVGAGVVEGGADLGR